MSGVKFLGKYACPECLISKGDFWKMGTKTDMTNRKRLARVDDDQLRHWLQRVRDWIFGPERIGPQA